MIARVELPWPDRRLHPNARIHWAAKSKVTKRARHDAAWAAKAAGLNPLAVSSLNVTAVFSPPDKRRRDADGMLSSIKPYLDGISDVVSVDDHLWNISIRREQPKAPGSVSIEISEAT